MTWGHDGAEREDGATMVFVAATMVLLIGVAALAVDLSGLRLDRAIDQRITDAAATAGAITTFEANGRDGCLASLNYLALNAPEIAADAFAAETCSSIPTSCLSTDPAFVEPISVGRFAINVVHPVPDGHPLMTSAAIGAPPQPSVAADGDQCARIGVQISADRESTFAKVIGSNANTTTVHSVAIAFKGANATSPVNLLILDRTGCHTVHSEGQGGIIVGAVQDGSDLLPGWGAADSDGTDCGGSEGVFYKQGADSTIRADGPLGCANDDPVTTTVGEGCGILQTLAPTVAGTCSPTGCQADGPPASTPLPLPTTMSERLTRQPIDHAYNCVSDYDWTPATPTVYGDIYWATEPLTAANGQDIPGCSDGSPHVYDLLDTIGPNGAPPGYATYSGSCVLDSSDPAITITVPTWFDCDPFIVRTTVTINAPAVFQGDVDVTGGSGVLDVTSGNGTVVFRGGTLQKDGQAVIRFNDTFVYFSKMSGIVFQGGTGELTWTAPDSGDFRNLALWSDSAATHYWAGQAVLDLGGAFFVPWAEVEYAGNGAQKQVSAQFIAWRLNARGNGALVLAPILSEIVPVDPPIVSELIR